MSRGEGKDDRRIPGSGPEPRGEGAAGNAGGPRKRLFRLGGRARVPEEVDDEVRFHLERKVEALVGQGMGEEEARREALRRFGDVDDVKRAMREETMRRTTGNERADRWDGFVQDLRYGARQLLRSPGFTLVTVLTLALGIGATTAIFSVVDGILFKPLPFPHPERLVAVWADLTRRGGPADEWLNFPNAADLRERSRTLEAVGMWDGGGATLTGQGEPRAISVGAVTADLFPGVLQVEPALGRSFRPEEDVPGAPGTAVLSDGFWRRVFGGERGVVGSTITIDGEGYTVVGVMGPDFRTPFMPAADVWVPLRQDVDHTYCGRGGACLHAAARLADGATLASARMEANRIARDLEAEHPRANVGEGFTLRPLRRDLVADARTQLLVLLGAVGFVLVIACVNVANLLMARSSTRASELAVRGALGAGRGRITRQLLTESGLMALLGGAGGLLLAWLGTGVLVSLAPPGTPRVADVGVDARVLAFALGVTALAGILFGVVPSLRSSRAAPAGALHGGGRGRVGARGGARARSVLVAAQVSLALVLLVGAGLLLRSFRNLRAADLGYRPEGVLVLRLGLPQTRYPDDDARRGFVHRAEERLGSLPGVTGVGAISSLPLGGANEDVTFTVEGRPVPEPGQEHAVWYRRVTPGYMGTMGMTFVAGRGILPSDDERAPPVVVINQSMAQRWFPDGDALGSRVNLNSTASPVWREIVGIVADTRHFGIREEAHDALYLPYDQSPSGAMWLTVRSPRTPATLADDVRRAVAELDPSMAAAQMAPMTDVVARALGPERFITSLLGLFAAVALTLAVVGLYGVVSYGVNGRLREMGVRLALGASGGEVSGLVVRGSLAVVAVGLGVGLVAALALTRLLGSLLYGVGTADPVTFGATALVLVLAAVAAAALPARRAARIDPVRVLKAE